MFWRRAVEEQRGDPTFFLSCSHATWQKMKEGGKEMKKLTLVLQDLYRFLSPRQYLPPPDGLRDTTEMNEGWGKETLYIKSHKAP